MLSVFALQANPGPHIVMDVSNRPNSQFKSTRKNYCKYLHSRGLGACCPFLRACPGAEPPPRKKKRNDSSSPRRRCFQRDVRFVPPVFGGFGPRIQKFEAQLALTAGRRDAAEDRRFTGSGAVQQGFQRPVDRSRRHTTVLMVL